MHKITVKDFPYLSFGDVRGNERFVTIINNISSQPATSGHRQPGTARRVKVAVEAEVRFGNAEGTSGAKSRWTTRSKDRMAGRSATMPCRKCL